MSAMIALDQISTAGFLDRHFQFNDSVLRSVGFAYKSFGQPVATFSISVRDREAAGKWCNVAIRIGGVTEMRFLERHNTTNQVLSDRLVITWRGGNVWCDLALYTTEVMSEEETRQSDCYCVGRVLHWIAGPYSEE
jgi:hypothetical protein